ncbi:MAG: polymer-forming cytoskeletal protein [Bacteroidales bacterium]|nr:polymer-forming cytoskeletal protein [Bacteroidales bacterium]MBN2764451.1 polymer-forming cytoskeletal protein [Bacteroidales bacterium]
MAKILETDNNVINQIGVGTEITGDVSTNGDIRIDGVLNGNLKTKGKLVIGETGTVKGEITCKNTVVEGSVNGKITVAELLTLKATSSFNGDINTRRLAIEPGAKFTGNCNMSMDASPTNKNETEKPAEGFKKP